MLTSPQDGVIGGTTETTCHVDYRDWKIYIGPTPRSKPFWDRFGWRMCDCDACDGRDLIVRRPA